MHADRRRTTTSIGLVALVFLVIGAASSIDRFPLGGALRAQTSWRGLVVAPERRCAPYDADEYRYPQSVEDRIIGQLGGVYGPYTGRWFASKSETDIEHMVARSGARQRSLRRRFSHQTAFRHRPVEPHAGGSPCESLRESGPRRGRVAAGSEPLLVRGSRDRGPATVRAHHRPT